MNIMMFTNTYAPHVGGVAHSVGAFTAAYRARGHRVLVVAPRFEHAPDHEQDVVRVPAVQNFNGSDFSVPVPAPGVLAASLEEFTPDVVHSHHPFLLGDTALRVAATHDVPVVFTHHTMYEQYTHYVPGDSPRMQRFAIDLSVGYCNLCDAVIAPSDSVARILRGRGVTARLETIPTGIDVPAFRRGDRDAGRRRAGIPGDAFVVGHVGRLAPEKNLDFLARALARFAAGDARGRVVIAGTGPSRDAIAERFEAEGASGRLSLLGTLDRTSLADLYRSLDVFAFASRSETQGLVVAEAMAAGAPVVALDASGVREVVRDGDNGRLLGEDASVEDFVAALGWVRDLTPDARAHVAAGVAQTAERFSMERTAAQALELYADTIRAGRAGRDPGDGPWQTAQRRLAEEWKIVKNLVAAAGDAWLGLGNDSGDD